MNQKSLLLATALIALLAIAGVFWCLQKRQVMVNQPPVTEAVLEAPKFVTDVDSDVDHWQMKETEFFTIKFPKEWYWLESDLEKTGYRSRVITNNPNFEIDKYADIRGGTYHMTAQDGTLTSIPLQDSEVVISFDGAATSNVGTPEQSLNATLQSMKREPYPVDCQRLSDPHVVPARAYCSFIDTAIKSPQKVQMYFTVNALNNIVLSALTTETTTVPKSILDKIAASMVVKETW